MKRLGASNLVPKDTNAVSDVFLRDLSSSALRRISFSPKGAQLADPSDGATISNNGAVVGFTVGYATINQWTRGSGRSQIVDEGWEGGGDCGPRVVPFSPAVELEGQRRAGGQHELIAWARPASG